MTVRSHFGRTAGKLRSDHTDMDFFILNPYSVSPVTVGEQSGSGIVGSNCHNTSRRGWAPAVLAKTSPYYPA
jgi:hypothetical protein